MTFRLQGPQITGMLPYSRLKKYPATAIATVPSCIASLPVELFPEMLQKAPQLGQRLVEIMSDRIRENTHVAAQQSLGGSRPAWLMSSIIPHRQSEGARRACAMLWRG